MLADGAHECLGLVRYFDTDGYDVAAVPAQIEGLLGRLAYLFLGKRGCLESVTFTRVQTSLIQHESVLAPCTFMSSCHCVSSLLVR